jgi:DNA-binding transcriptional LysR family regulator
MPRQFATRSHDGHGHQPYSWKSADPGLLQPQPFTLLVTDTFENDVRVLSEAGNAARRPSGFRGEADRRAQMLSAGARRGDWAKWLEASDVAEADVDPSRGLVFDITTMAIDAAESGLGVANTREAQVADALRSGRIVAPFRRDLLRGEGCYFLTLPRRRDEPHVAAFRDWLLSEAGSHAGT